MFTRPGFLAIFVCVTVACDSSDSPKPQRPRDAGTQDGGTDATLPDSGASIPDSARPPSEDTEPGENDIIDNARRVETDGTLVTQDVHKARQANYFEFEGKAGAFYELVTNDERFAPDNVITVFDDERRAFAENDLGEVWPGDGTDARLVVHLPRSGTFYVRVEDRTTPQSVFDSPDFLRSFYQLRVRELTPGMPGFAIAASGEPTPIEFGALDSFSYRVATLLGTFTRGAVDRFEFRGGPAEAMIARIQPSGRMGNGSTAKTGSVAVRDADRHALARADWTGRSTDLHPPLDDRAYVVELEAGDDLGDNGYYAMDVVVIPDNPPERDDANNGATSGAEALAFEGMGRRRARILTRLPDGDVDYFSFDAIQNGIVTALCEAESGGSGVRGLRAEIRDASDAVLGSATETPTQNLEIAPIVIATGGTFYLRVFSAAAPVEGDVEPWIRCAVSVVP